MSTSDLPRTILSMALAITLISIPKRDIHLYTSIKNIFLASGAHTIIHVSCNAFTPVNYCGKPSFTGQLGANLVYFTSPSYILLASGVRASANLKPWSVSISSHSVALNKATDVGCFTVWGVWLK